MTILGFLFLVFVLYLGYRLVFDFIIPVYKTTKRIRKGFREMQDRMNPNEGQHQQEKNYSTQTQSSESNKGGAGEYIDFEEVKD